MSLCKSFFAACLTISVVSGQTASADDARIQKLYSDAKSAQARGDLEAATASYENLIRVAPTLAAAYNNLGALYFRQHEYEKAAKVLAAGLRADPSMVSASALLGISLFEMGRYNESRARLEAVLRVNPNDSTAQMYLARVLIKLDEFTAAAAQLQLISTREPKNQEIWYLLSKVYMKLSEVSLAKMNGIDSDSVLAHQLSAEVMESMNNFDGAIVELKKAVDKAPMLPGNHYKLGEAYWNQSQWESAAEQFQAELTIDSGNCMARWKAANIVLQKNGDPVAALADLNRAISSCPNLGGAMVDRSRTLAKLNRNEEALADALGAEKINSDDPAIHFLLARIYRALGRTDDAGKEMKIFSQMDERARTAVAERAQQVIKNKETAH